ncbi:MAG: isopentenyl phosphate kinase, partial [Methanobacteriaceae archaeon]|nr:isopentenyl phosphate kinase [Methanobacteriaceae archaeon]
NSNPDLVNKLIIVHGAGSFGHPPAKKHKIGQAFEDEEYLDKRIGFCEIQNEVKRLNSIICEVFVKNGIPAIAIPPSSFITTSNKRVHDFNLDLIKSYLNEGFIPILYGDVVLDTEIKMAVISGDQIIQHIAKFIKSDRVVLGTDVDGVYTKNPKTHDDAVHIDVVSSIEDIKSLESTTNVDVTGGMVGKVKELLELADLGIDSEIINANEPGAISKTLQGMEVKGTKISKK